MRITQVGLILLFLSQAIMNQVSAAGLLASNWGIGGNTNKEFHVDYFLYNRHFQNDLIYMGVQWKGVAQSELKWPTSVNVGIHGGYRWLTQTNQMLGVHIAHESFADVTNAVSKAAPDLPYARGFSRYNIGYEHHINPIGITVNTYLPWNAPFVKVDHQYLNSGNLDGGAYEELIGSKINNPQVSPEVAKAQVTKTAKDNFFYQDSKRYQKHFYLQEGSYGLDVKLTYNLTQYNALPFGGVYYFYDSYGNNIVGGALGCEYKPHTAFSANVKYTYDRVHRHYIAFGVKLTTSDYHPKRWGTANQLLKPVETGLSPILKRNQAPREVFNTYRKVLGAKAGIDSTLPLEGVKKEIKSRYKKFILTHHPDKRRNTNSEDFRDQNEAWTELRAAYGLTNER